MNWTKKTLIYYFELMNYDILKWRLPSASFLVTSSVGGF